MARHATNTVDYFPHDAHASDGDTVTILEGQFGNDGYAFWFKLLERISTTENHVIDCRNPVKYQLLLAKSHINPERGDAILNLLASLEAIDPTLWKQKIIWCQKFVDRVADAYHNRRRPVPSCPLFVVETPIPTVETTISTPKSTQTKLKETKLKETKLNIGPTIELPDWIQQATWDAYLEMRKAKGKPPTLRALELVAKTLTSFRELGDDPNEVLNQSIVNSWTDVYRLKGDRNNGHKPTTVNQGYSQGIPGNRPTGAFSDIET